MTTDSRIFVAGHRGLVGSALTRRLQKGGYTPLTRPHAQLDLRDASAVMAYFDEIKPEYVFLAAARVGGIGANSAYPVEFLRDNLLIQLAVIDAAHRCGVSKLLFLGSSCVYPKFAAQPIKEEYLLTGPLEQTNEPYAVAKIAGVKLCEAFRREYGARFFSVMPTNLYGPNDNFDLATSHVLPAFVRRFHEAKVNGEEVVTLWGTGAPRREFLHVDDLADACIFLMESLDDLELINIGWGKDLEVRELADLVASIVGYTGTIAWDPTKPDGTPRKLLDVSRLKSLGWTPSISLVDGIRSTYRWFRDNQAEAVTATGA